MRGRTKLTSIVAILSVVILVSAVFASGILDVSRISLLGAPGIMEPDSPGGETVFVTPSKVVDGSLRPPSSKVTVAFNISSASDVYTWQIYIKWNQSVLTINKIIQGEFLARSPNLTSSEVLGCVINATNNPNGISMFSDTILGNIGGQSAPPTGRLVSIEFQVVGNGKTVLNITSPNTVLLNSAGTTIDPTKTNGWFNNIPGDTNYSGKVDGTDLSAMGLAWLSSPGKITWNPGCDFDNSGKVDGSDLSYLGLYWLKVYW